MYYVKKIIVKSTISLVVSIVGAIGTQVGLRIWENNLSDKFVKRTEPILKTKS